ncbi:MAG: M48 family metalloprotease [Saonia sp.]
MKQAIKFLDELQGLILLIGKKSGHRATILEIKHLKENDPDRYNELVEELNNINTDDLMQSHVLNPESLQGQNQKENIQKVLGRQKGEKYFSKYIDQWGWEQMVNTNLKPESKYQNLVNYSMLHSLKTDLINGSKEMMGYEISNFPILASTATDSFNAQAIKFRDSNESIILFEEQTFYFALKLSKLIISAVPLINGKLNFEQKKIKENISKNLTVIENFSLTIFNSMFPAYKKIPFIIDFPKEKQTFLSTCTDSIEFFIMGHELGHILLNHHDKKNTKEFFALNEYAYLASRNWQKEFEADYSGFIFFSNSMSNIHPMDTSFIGLDLMFTVMHILAEAKQIINGVQNSKISTTHPPPLKRQQKIRMYIQSLLKSYQVPLENAVNVSEVFLEIWDLNLKSSYKETYENLKKFHKEKYRP